MQHFDEYTIEKHKDGALRPYDHAIGLLKSCLKNTQAGIEDFEVREDEADHGYDDETIRWMESHTAHLRAEAKSIEVAISLLNTVNKGACRPLPQYPRMINEPHIENQTATEPTEKP